MDGIDGVEVTVHYNRFLPPRVPVVGATIAPGADVTQSSCSS